MRASRYRRVFVTGALGCVGRALTAYYRDLGVETRGVDVRAEPSQGVVAGDVTRPEDWRVHLHGCDVAVHTAAIVTNNVSRDEAWRINVLGTRRVIETVRDAGILRFVHISSLAAMRFVTDDHADETAPVMPTGNPYVDTKIASEHAVLAAHAAGEIKATIIRPADVYGPGSRPWTVTPVQMIKKGLFFLPAYGQGLFRPVYIDDLVRGIAMAAEKDAAIGHIIVLGGEDAVTCKEFFGYYYRMLGKGRPRVMSSSMAIAIAEGARLVSTLLGRPTEVGRGAMEMLAKKTVVSNAKARRLLGWHPGVSLEEGMRRTEVWLTSEKLI